MAVIGIEGSSLLGAGVVVDIVVGPRAVGEDVKGSRCGGGWYKGS